MNSQDLNPIENLIWEYFKMAHEKVSSSNKDLSYLPTPPLGQDMTQGHF